MMILRATLSKNKVPNNNHFRSSGTQMFFKISVSQKFCNRATPVLEFLLMKLQPLQNKRIPVNVANFCNHVENK